MKFHNLFIYLWLILAALSLSSCLFYMKEESQIDNNSDQDEWLIKKSIYRGLAQDQYIVLRSDTEMWHLFDMKLSADQKTLTAKKEKITTAYQNIIERIRDKKTIGYAKSQKDFINQVHFFVNHYDFNEETEKISINIDEISKIEIYQHDNTTSNQGTLGIVVLVSPIAAVAVLLIATVIFCNCPYVYSQGEDQLVFEGNLFSGSIYPSLERTDYLPILTKSKATELLNLSIANEKKEILNINQLSLLTVKHESGVKVLMDQAGIPHTIINPISPIESTSFRKYEHTKDLLHADGLAYDFADSEINPISTLSELDLVFDNSIKANNGKLILKVKNDNWGRFMYEEVSSMLGRSFEWYHDKETNRSQAEMTSLMKRQGVLMSVSMYQDGLWQPVDYIWPTGSKAYREIVIPVDLQNQQEDEIRIKLEGGFKFWDIDQAAIDFSEDLELKVHESFAESNEMEIDQEIINELRYDDEMYMNHLQQGERIDLQFQVQEQKDESTYSYFLKGKGYYIVEKDYENRMRIGDLLQFRREGGFSHYSFKRFNEMVESVVVN